MQAPDEKDDRQIKELKAAEARFQRARDDFSAASAARAKAFRRASDAGFSVRRIASEVDLSAGRVHQVLRSDS